MATCAGVCLAVRNRSSGQISLPEVGYHDNPAIFNWKKWWREWYPLVSPWRSLTPVRASVSEPDEITAMHQKTSSYGKPGGRVCQSLHKSVTEEEICYLFILEVSHLPTVKNKLKTIHHDINSCNDATQHHPQMTKSHKNTLNDSFNTYGIPNLTYSFHSKTHVHPQMYMFAEILCSNNSTLIVNTLSYLRMFLQI